MASVLFAAVTCADGVIPHTFSPTGPEQFAQAHRRAQNAVPEPTNADPVLVEMRSGIDLSDLHASLSQNLSLDVNVSSKVRGWASVQVPDGHTTDGIVKAVKDTGLAEQASRHVRFSTYYEPNDEYARYRDPDTASEYGQYYLYDINAPQAWDLQKGSSDTIIAVVDSGVSIYHEDLYDNMWHNSGEIPNNGIDDDGNGYVDDYWGYDFVGDNVGSSAEMANEELYMPREDSYPTVWDDEWWIDQEPYTTDPAIGDGLDNNGDGVPDGGVTHGTMVAGLANAVTDNNLDVAGVAFNCQTMALRITNAEAWGWDQDAAAAIYYAADAGADVINMSFGFGLREDIPQTVIDMITDAIQYAVARGCIPVAAAGNARANEGYTGGLDFPGDMPETISVGGVDWNQEVSWFSSYASEGQVLDTVAPAEGTFTTSVIENHTWRFLEWLYPGEYQLGDDLLGPPAAGGTSFSTPLVSGYAALLRSRYADFDYLDFRDILHNSSQDLGDAGYDVDYGYGEMDMYAGILYGDQHNPPIPEPATTTMIILGLAALAWRLRRNSRADQ